MQYFGSNIVEDVAESWVEADGGGWSWVEVGISWMEVGAWFSNDLLKRRFLDICRCAFKVL